MDFLKETAYIVDPETEHYTSCDKQLVETSQTTTNSAGCVFANVKRRKHTGGTDSETSNEPSNVESIAIHDQ